MRIDQQVYDYVRDCWHAGYKLPKIMEGNIVKGKSEEEILDVFAFVLKQELSNVQLQSF